jgi:hypothetical protein
VFIAILIRVGILLVLTSVPREKLLRFHRWKLVRVDWVFWENLT